MVSTPSGARALMSYANDQVVDDELSEAQKRWLEAGLVSKEMLFYYRICVSTSEEWVGDAVSISSAIIRV